MPLLNDADEVMLGTARVHRIYLGSTLVWPKQIETWSPWYMVGDAVAAAPCAWFAGGVVHNYDTGGHEQARFRYSNLGRVHWRGIMKNVSGAAFGAGTAIAGCNISDPNVPKPVDDNRMGSGPGGTAYSPVMGGGYVRFDAGPYQYHHLLKVANTDAATIGAGVWFAIDTIYAFAADT